MNWLLGLFHIHKYYIITKDEQWGGPGSVLIHSMCTCGEYLTTFLTPPVTQSQVNYQGVMGISAVGSQLNSQAAADGH